MLSRQKPYRIAAVAVLLGSLANLSPAFAAPGPDESAPPPPAADAAAPGKHHHHDAMKHEDPTQKVEDRIKMLHAKLKITPDQEAAWGDVAKAMRDNAAEVSSLIEERHDNADKMTAVQDMQSYQKIAQAHADGLNSVIPAFSKLYDSMSDEQKENADMVFGGFHDKDHGAMAAKK